MDKIRENKMGTAPILKLIVSMSLPAMFSMLIQALYNIVDSVFVSNYSNEIITGNESLLAVNIAYPLQLILIAVAVGTGVGVNSLIARRLGAKQQDQADSAATHGFVMSIVGWLVFVLIGIFLAEPFISLYTNDPNVYKASIYYIRIVLICSLGAHITCMLEKVLQSTGNMIMPMIIQLTGAIVNIVLDPVFIYVLDMGVAGAAIATVIAQHISAILAIFFVFGKKQLVTIKLRGFRFNGTVLKNIYVVALPAMVMQAIGSVMVMGINFIISLTNSTDTAKSAATNVFGVYFKLQSFVFMPVFGLNQGSTPIIGYNYGAGNRKRMYSTIKWASVFALIIMTIGCLIFQIIPEVLLGMFNPDKEMIEIGTVALRIISICFIPASVGIVFTGVFQAVGKGIRSLIMSLLRQLGIILPVAYLLSSAGLKDIWFAFPIAEAGSLLVAILFFVNLVRGEFKSLKPCS